MKYHSNEVEKAALAMWYLIYATQNYSEEIADEALSKFRIYFLKLHSDDDFQKFETWSLAKFKEYIAD